MFRAEAALVRVKGPVSVCGDIHGQFYDLLRIFDCNGYPDTCNYVFLGDYVDRGRQSLESICLLFGYKILNPEKITLLRGNHECEDICKVYGFYDECRKRLSVRIWKKFCVVFNLMPVAAVIEDSIMCMHGGIGPELKTLGQIEQLEKPIEVGSEGLVCDLLWADPESEQINMFEPNEDRGVSVFFNEDALSAFLEGNDLDLVVRAHEVVEEGYEFFGGRQLVTVFSAPNYAGEYDNKAALLKVEEGMKCSFRVFCPFEEEKKKGRNKRKSKGN